jgi:hypothetical protein
VELVTFRVTDVVSDETCAAIQVIVPVWVEPGTRPVGSAVIVSVVVDICGMLVPGIAVMVPELGDTVNQGVLPGGSLVVMMA